MKSKVLIIEDDPDIRANIETLLLEEEYIVETAADGFTGIEKAKRFLPDIIICDIMMKGISGYDVIKSLLSNKETRTIPFIFLSAKAEKEEIRMGMELGADDYLTKPFKNCELLNSIQTRLIKSKIFKEDNTIDNFELKTNEKLKLDKAIYLRSKGDIVFFKVSDINYISAANQYSEVHLLNKSFLLSHKTLKEWESMLPCENFMRIHKSTIIRVENVVRFVKFTASSYRIYLKDVDFPFEISKRKLSGLNIQK